MKLDIASLLIGCDWLEEQAPLVKPEPYVNP